MNNRDRVDPIPDVQGSEDRRRLAIDKVGIKAIRHPVKVAERDGGVQHTVALFNMYVALPHQFKGTHMSRFVDILNSHEREISVASFKQMLAEMVVRLEAQAGHVEMNFPYFINKAAPVSKVNSLMDYEVTFFGEILPKSLAVAQAERFANFTLPLINVFSYLLTPLSAFTSFANDRLLSAFGVGSEDANVAVTMPALRLVRWPLMTLMAPDCL